MHDDCNNRSPEGHGLLMTTVPSSSLCSHVFADGAINNVIVSVSAQPLTLCIIRPLVWIFLLHLPPRATVG